MQFDQNWDGIYDSDKVVLCLSENHQTTQNIKARGAFTISFADTAHVKEADYVGLVPPLAEGKPVEFLLRETEKIGDGGLRLNYQVKK